MTSAHPKPNRKRRVVGYVRVSTDEQALGPASQRRALGAWCEANDAQLVAVHSDVGVSGGAEIDRRPGLLQAIEALGDHRAEVLLVAKRDRLARDVVVAAMVERLAERKGARVLAANGAGNGSGPEAMLMRGMIDLFAQYERAIIRVRTRTALSEKRARGERVGAIPLGYRLSPDGTHLEPSPHEQRVVARIIEMRQDGASIRAIARELNAESIPARGSRWHPTSVARILRRKAA